MKKTISICMALILLFVFPMPAFAAGKKDACYIIMYTKASYKNTPYEELFSDHREFLNSDNYEISGIKSISVIAAYRNDNPHIYPPYYVLAIQLNTKYLSEASLKALNIISRGISPFAWATDTAGYDSFCKKFIPETTVTEAHYALYKPGDIMCFNEVTSASARAVLRISVGLDKKENYPWLIGDMNKDGQLTSSDARTILRISVGLE